MTWSKSAQPVPRPVANAIAPDVKIDFVFDQSSYVVNAIDGLIREGLLGALLTGLMVLLFLRDWRSALIVVTTIPFALLSAVVWLWATGQTINIMTLGGLALAVGVLVDEATVSVESIHTHLESGLSRPRAVLAASSKTAVPRLLAMISILAVFVPSFFMAGVARQLFVPLSLAVGFAMVSSYLLSSSFVPVLSTWLMRGKHGTEGAGGLYRLYGAYLRFMLRFRWPLVGAYLAGAALMIWILYPRIGTEIFPSSEAGQLQIRMRAPAGTVIEQTEMSALKTLDVIERVVGPENVDISTDFVGAQAASYPINTIYLFTSGPQEAVLRVALKPGTPLRSEDLRERLRKELHTALPDTTFSFEAPDIISQVMSFGSPTPVEVDIQGPSMPANRGHAAKIFAELQKIPELRDLQYIQALDYPTLDVTIDRDRAGQLGLTMADVARPLVTATSSSRFVSPNYWRDPKSGNAFQIQVQIPPHKMTTVEEVENLPVMTDGVSDITGHPLVRDLAKVRYGTTFGEVDRYNMQRVVGMTANIHGVPLGSVGEKLRVAIARAGKPPLGVTVFVRGQIPPLEQTLSGLGIGLLLAVAVIFLLLPKIVLFIMDRGRGINVNIVKTGVYICLDQVSDCI